MFDIGSSLREARLRQELDFPELEARTKIRPKYLRALEDERFDILPAPTYIKGFLRNYAEALGLDGQPFVDEYNSRFTIGDEYADVRARRVPVPRRDDRSARESRIAVGALLAIAVLTALVIAAWRFGGPENEVVPRLRRTELGRRDGAGRCSRGAGQPRRPCGRRGARGWRSAPDRSPAGSCTAERSSDGQRKSFEGRRLQLALREPDDVVVRVNGNRVELPAGTAFVVTARRIVTASAS